MELDIHMVEFCAAYKIKNCGSFLCSDMENLKDISLRPKNKSRVRTLCTLWFLFYTLLRDNL